MTIILNKMRQMKSLLVVGVLLLYGNTALFSEEGMWTFFSLPANQLKEQYNFTPDASWFDHVRLSAVQIGGGSGAFVSPDGLIMTNHHVVLGTALKYPGLDVARDGYIAKSRNKELSLNGMSANILVAMKNVTGDIMSSVNETMSDEERRSAVKKKTDEIVEQANKQNSLSNRVIFLNYVNEYWLYTYKKLTDLRLVFTPEINAAALGGYFYDNFTFPRYCLDVAFVRAYENDKPYKPEHYFKWKTKGALENELVFVAGNPGTTVRHLALSELQFFRECQEKLTYIKCKLTYDMALETDFSSYTTNSKVSLENRFKVYSGIDYGFGNPEIMENAVKTHEQIRARLESNPEMYVKYCSAVRVVDSLMELKRVLFGNSVFEIRELPLYNYADALWQLAYNCDTSVQGSESKIKAFENVLKDTTSPGKEYCVKYLTMYFRALIDNGIISTADLEIMIGFSSPSEAAVALCKETQLDDKEYRLRLMAGGKSALAECKDPILKYYSKIDAGNQSRMDALNREIENCDRVIAKAYNLAFGNERTPDANFTLRLSYGQVKGCDVNGYSLPWKTTLYGIFDRALSHSREGDFKLPERYFKGIDGLDLATPCNFITSNDIVGGNSGSSVINKNAEVVGLVFDGNFESIIGKYVFDKDHSRAVCVHTAYIIEALRNLYGLGKLADEIEGE